jgi:branched-chain amino acid transport system permease protein
MVYAASTIGFTLVYGISRLPNFAHGALYVANGFIVWSLLNILQLNYILSIILSLIITGIIGAAIYQFILIRVRGMATSEIIASYAMIGGLVIFLLWLFTHYNRIGLALRCMAQDERAAMMLGIDSDRMALMAMALGSILAGLAGVVLLPMGNIVVEAGYNVLILAIAVCIVGGLGSWGGAVLAAFMIGFAQIITLRIASQFHMVVALLAIIITLIFRPSGIFGRQKELEERV